MYLSNLLRDFQLNESEVRVFNISEHSKFAILESELDAVASSIESNDTYEAYLSISEAHGIDSDDLYVITEDSDILAKKQEIIEKLKKSRSSKERKKLLSKLKNLNKIKFVRKNKGE